MSEPSIPAPDGQGKPDTLIIKMLPCDVQAYGVEEMRFFLGERMRVIKAADEPQPTPPVKPRRRQKRKSGLYAVLHAAQQHGITHPTVGGFLQLPREFDAILALEHKSVAQVVLEVLRQTIGKVGDGADGRQEWAKISKRHFARVGLMPETMAQRGIKGALAKGYIVRRQVGARSYEYAIRWKGTN
jgi:hypothetical protein